MFVVAVVVIGQLHVLVREKCHGSGAKAPEEAPKPPQPRTWARFARQVSAKMKFALVRLPQDARPRAGVPRRHTRRPRGPSAKFAAQIWGPQTCCASQRNACARAFRWPRVKQYAVSLPRWRDIRRPLAGQIVYLLFIEATLKHSKAWCVVLLACYKLYNY